jgi:hypothetical protein
VLLLLRLLPFQLFEVKGVQKPSVLGKGVLFFVWGKEKLGEDSRGGEREKVIFLDFFDLSTVTAPKRSSVKREVIAVAVVERRLCWIE